MGDLNSQRTYETNIDVGATYNGAWKDGEANGPGTANNQLPIQWYASK